MSEKKEDKPADNKENQDMILLSIRTEGQ